jgi:hypothetical protein
MRSFDVSGVGCLSARSLATGENDDPPPETGRGSRDTLSFVS